MPIQADSQHFTSTTSDSFNLCGYDSIVFGGNNDQLAFIRGGYNTAFMVGDDQSVLFSTCGENAIFDFGHSLSVILDTFTTQAEMIYGAQMDRSSSVQLLDGQTATETRYTGANYDWGTQVTVHTNGSPVTGIADFDRDAHVIIKPV